MLKRGFGIFLSTHFFKCLIFVCVAVAVAFLWHVLDARAKNIKTYSDTLSSSVPSAHSNHTITFDIGTDIAPGGYIDFVPPAGFAVRATSTLVATHTFSARNVELYVNGSPRVSSSTGDALTDTVTITYGSPGLVRYTFNPSSGVMEGDRLQLRLGTHTSLAQNGGYTVSTSTGTTTYAVDTGIQNASTTGTHQFTLTITDGVSEAYAKFLVALINQVGLGPADTTEDIPPFRFNGSPSGDVGGTTLSVEMSVETDEFAICKYATTPGVDFAAMTEVFDSTGLVVHTQLITGLANDSSYTYYVRCIDDEGNFNIDDYVISFTILSVPDGEPNTVGSTTGDGTGSGDNGTGTGSDNGGETGAGGSGSNTSGGTSGGGGSGGGGGGGTGGNSGNTAGGGFESSDAAYESGDARVIINGYAFPNSDIVVLVDGQVADTSETADASGKFAVVIDAIARGVYTFGVYAVDSKNVKSSTFSTSFSVQGARTSSLSNVNIMPTVAVAPNPVDLGGTAVVSGYAQPNADITVEHRNDKDGSPRTYTTTSNGSGVWSVDVNTSGFSRGTYKVRAKAVQPAGVETNYSDYTYYGVGEEASGQINADLNRDGSVNLIDFSILLFHWGTNGGSSDPPADINQDGNVSLTDFSIMLFQWTG